MEINIGYPILLGFNEKGMMKNSIVIFCGIFVCIFLCACQSTEKKLLEPKAKHVILIGIDGWGAYSMEKAKIPNIRFLMDNGTYTLKKRSVLPSSSAPNWASMYMGAGPELHGYCEWGSQVPDLPSRVLNEDNIFPTVFSVLRKADPQAEIGNICEWDGIRYLVDTLALNYDKHVFEVKEDSTATVRYAVDYIKNRKPTLVNIVYDALDHVGHVAGHDTPSYYAKLEELDKYVGEIVTAIKEAGIWDESIVIVTADHGGIKYNHGGRTMQEMETPFIMCGSHVKSNYELQESMMQFDIASTISYILALEQPQVWIGRPMVSAFE